MRLPNFWDYIAGDIGETRSIFTNSQKYALTLRRMNEGVWKYRFVTNDGWDTIGDVEGHIVLDITNRSLIKQTVTRDTFSPYRSSRRDFDSIQFRRIAGLFFIDAMIYTHLPTLKSISLSSIKCKN